MPLMPKRVKYRKTQRGSRAGNASRTLKIDFGEFGLQTLDRAWITNIQIEAARVAMTRNMKRKGKLWIRIFPDKSVTARPPETRMGKGKGNPEHWVAVVRPVSLNPSPANLCASPRTSSLCARALSPVTTQQNDAP